ncbi:MAG: isoprenylcysteine carboxylmethyltransferase family protein [Anaerolineales bacterium]|nr:isoprenylcysteine carboxylmethyltransferase family protein [Anaerolineales bacterium]
MIFKICIGALIVCALFVHGKHGMSKERQKTRIETKRLLVPLLLFLTFDVLLLLYFFTSRLDGFRISFPNWIRWLGVVLLFGGDAILFLAHSALGRNWSLAPEIKENHTLVVSGIYKKIRHPMYSAYLLLGLGFLLSSANWLIGFLFLIPIATICLRRIGVEDQMMLEKFGDEYREYAKRTGALIPKLR